MTETLHSILKKGEPSKLAKKLGWHKQKMYYFSRKPISDLPTEVLVALNAIRKEQIREEAQKQKLLSNVKN